MFYILILDYVLPGYNIHMINSSFKMNINNNVMYHEDSILVSSFHHRNIFVLFP